MPDAWTHILCGYDTISKLENESTRRLAEEKSKVFNLGNQGPDIFIYKGVFPWIINKEEFKLGTFMHREGTGDFFIEGLKYLRNNINKQEDFETLFTYLAGFMCHFSLDKNTHPYIYYNTKRSGIRHVRFEGAIASILLKEKKGINIYEGKIHEEVDVGPTLPQSIVSFYSYLLNKLFKNQIKWNFVNKSYKDTKAVLKSLYNFRLMKFLCPKFMTQKSRYMNRNHNIWWDSRLDRKIHFESFDDMYDKSVMENKEMIDTAWDFIEGKVNTHSLKEVFPNISYHTGERITMQNYGLLN